MTMISSLGLPKLSLFDESFYVIFLVKRYIEFYNAMSVPMAIALCGQPLLGQPVMVKPSEAERNLVQSTSVTSAEGGLGPYSGGARSLYVGNLPVTIKEDQLRQVFEPFGAVELLQMPTEPGTGNCKGYA